MILLVTASVGSEQTGGSELYSQFVRCLNGNKVFRLGVTRSSRPVAPSLSRFQFKTIISSDRIWKKVLKRAVVVEPIYFLIRYLIVRHRIRGLIKRLNPEKIIISMRSEVLIVANDLLLNLNVPIYGMVEDTVERERDGSWILYWVKKRCYYRLMPKLQNIGVASENMSVYIQKRFNANSVVLRPSYESNFSSDFSMREPNRVKILFAGNLYAREALLAFIHSLEIWCSQNGEITVELYIASNARIEVDRVNFRVINLGWLNKDALLKYCKIVDFGYVPYSFKSQQRHAMSLAFPAKLGFYLSVGLPMILHGPIYSSFHTFNEINGVGFSISTLDCNEIVKCMSAGLKNHNSRLAILNNVRRTYYNYFSEEAFQNSFESFIS